MITQAPFPKEAPDVFWMINPFTEHLVDKVRAQRGFRDMGVAIIDLTRRTRRPDGVGWIGFAGWNMYKEIFAASLPKIAAMFAAFRLRENFRLAAAQSSAGTVDEMIAEVTKAWKPLVETAIKDGKADFPQFKQVFAISGSAPQWSIEFSEHFMKHMKLMIGKSDNHSASICIDALGFQYINGALAADGLYSRDFGGLWLGANYQGRLWKREHMAKTAQGATAKSVAMFLHLLEDNRLVSKEASRGMRAIMDLAGSWFYEGLDRAKRPIIGNECYAKIGLYGHCHDCAVITRATPDTGRIRYAIVGLDATSPNVLRSLVVKLDDYIIACQA